MIAESCIVEVGMQMNVSETVKFQTPDLIRFDVLMFGKVIKVDAKARLQKDKLGKKKTMTMNSPCIHSNQTIDH